MEPSDPTPLSEQLLNFCDAANAYLDKHAHLSMGELQEGVKLRRQALALLEQQGVSGSNRVHIAKLAGRLKKESHLSQPMMIFHKIFHAKDFKEWKVKKEVCEQIEKRHGYIEKWGISPSDYKNCGPILFGSEKLYHKMENVGIKPPVEGTF